MWTHYQELNLISTYEPTGLICCLISKHNVSRVAGFLFTVLNHVSETLSAFLAQSPINNLNTNNTSYNNNSLKQKIPFTKMRNWYYIFFLLFLLTSVISKNWWASQLRARTLTSGQLLPLSSSRTLCPLPMIHSDFTFSLFIVCAVETAPYTFRICALSPESISSSLLTSNNVLIKPLVCLISQEDNSAYCEKDIH